MDEVWDGRSDGFRDEAGIVGFGDRSTGRGNFGGEFGARNCNQWGALRSETALFPNYFGQTCSLFATILHTEHVKHNL